MPLWHHDLNKKKVTGGRKKPYRTKKAFEEGGFPVETILSDPIRIMRNTRGGTKKTGLLYDKFANVVDHSKRTTTKVEILRVVHNPVNPDYDRRKIITKGALIETSLGEAVVTSRPGQDGIINAVLSSKRG